MSDRSGRFRRVLAGAGVEGLCSVADVDEKCVVALDIFAKIGLSLAFSVVLNWGARRPLVRKTRKQPL